MVGKRVQFDVETWEAIQAVLRDSGDSFQELADEAFADLLKKRKQPVGFKAAPKESVGMVSTGPFTSKHHCTFGSDKPANQPRNAVPADQLASSYLNGAYQRTLLMLVSRRRCQCWQGQADPGRDG